LGMSGVGNTLERLIFCGSGHQELCSSQVFFSIFSISHLWQLYR
jgi:hypothetical protein